MALLVLAFGLVGLSPPALLIVGLVLITIALGARMGLLSTWLSRVSRLRWFFLAIFVLYLLGGMPGAVATGPAWIEALYRVGILVVLVGGVVICLAGLPAFELADGLSRLLRPLRPLGVPVEALSRRLAAALDAVVHMQAEVGKVPRQASAASLERLAQVFLAAERYQLPAQTGQARIRAASAADFALIFGLALLMLSLRFL